MGTTVPSIAEFFGNFPPATRAILTCAVGTHCNNLQELLPSSIVHRFCKASPRKTFEVQRLIGYVLPFFQEFISNFVVEVTALIGYFLMCLSDPAGTERDFSAGLLIPFGNISQRWKSRHMFSHSSLRGLRSWERNWATNSAEMGSWVCRLWIDF